MANDIYINDAFGTAHRNHASTGILPSFFNRKKAMGFLLSKEVEVLDKVFKNNTPPFLAIIGGAKVSSKIQILIRLGNKNVQIKVIWCTVCTRFRKESIGIRRNKFRL